jgi:hypothetical protein
MRNSEFVFKTLNTPNISYMTDGLEFLPKPTLDDLAFTRFPGNIPPISGIGFASAIC